MSTETATLFGPFVGCANTGVANKATTNKLMNIPKIFLFIFSPPPDDF
jgi:hypothetical protein